jgi:hypothetical protein
MAEQDGTAEAKLGSPDPLTEAAIKRWSERIQRADSLVKDKLTTILQNRKYVRGQAHDDGAPGLVRTNMIFSTMATQIPHIYAKDPDVIVAPVEHVDPVGYESVKKFAKTAELVLRRKVIMECKIKRRLKSNIRSILTTGEGWLKMVYHKDLGSDPITRTRMRDLQDNLRSVDYLMSTLKSEADVEAAKKNKFELLRQMEALKAQADPSKWSGFVIDRILTEDIRILDDSITDFDDYAQARAISHDIWMSDEEFQRTFNYKPTGTSYQNEQLPHRLRRADAAATNVSWRRVHEIWDLDTTTVYTMCSGEKRWARPPYIPQHLPHRFYPFYCDSFFPVDGEWSPLDLVRLMRELQDEYNRTRTTYAEHREDSLPVRIVRQGGSITPDDVARIRDRKPREIIVVNGNGQGNALGNDMGHLPNIPLQPEMYDVSQIRADMDLVSGTPDASRGNLTEAKTATEATILQEGMASRINDMRDSVEELLTDMLRDSLEVLCQCMPIEEVVEIAGPGAVWPELSRDQVYRLVQVSIRGGSTAKPNKQREREQWAEMLPVLREFVMSINEVLMSGNSQLAQAMITLLKETLIRFDERLDIQAILPFAGQDGQGIDTTAMQAAQQVPQLQQQLQQASEYITQLEEQLRAGQQQIADKSAEMDLRRQESQDKLELARESASMENERKQQEAAAKLNIDAERENRDWMDNMLARIEQRIAQAGEQGERAATENGRANDTAALTQALKTMQEMLVSMRNGRPSEMEQNA